jgi:chemosensory pili system protein ChpA (sensor histidine kinase/response regulator)
VVAPPVAGADGPTPGIDVTIEEPLAYDFGAPTIVPETIANDEAFEPPHPPPSVEAPVAADAAAESRVEFAEPHDRRDDDEEVGKLWPERVERRGQIRVNTQLLNNLVNYAGEVSIARSRMEQQVYGFRDNLSELSRNITRFRDQIRELEIQSESQILYRLEHQSASSPRGSDFDPLEFDRFSRLQQLSRQLAESLHDLTTIQGSLGNFIGEAEAVLQQQARINTELQEGLMRTRMVSFATQAGRLRHMVRQTARELGKRAELEFVGADVELDRTVLERMIGPFEHMIRNSLDHGIEAEAVRERAGKPPVGRITIATAQEGSEIMIRFADDGAGLKLESIRRKAIERGLIAPDTNVTEDALVQFILRSGFSTAEKVTELSGRGVGMDVVYSEVKQLGGSMSVDTRRGQGTTFIIRLPLTLSIAQALMVYVGDQLFAVPLASVANIIEYPVEHLNELAVGNNPLLKYGEFVYPYLHLGTRLGVSSTPRNSRKVPVLIARTGTREVAIQVDGLSGTREIVIKALSPQLAELKGLAGATILGDGRVILILDVAGLWYRDDAIHLEYRASPEPVKPVRERPVIMVVDDSLTVRKVTSKHLQKRGLDVLVAKDGLDAVEQLRDHVPDVMLVDIEMPRMDGYELTTRVRGDARLKHVPIIMITSRAGAKHRQKAFELGVDLYMSKPYQEDELFRNIDALLAKGHASERH